MSEFDNLVQNVYKANEQYYNYTDEKIKRIKNIFYKKIIKNSYDLYTLINNINKFFDINISVKQLKRYITKESNGYRLTFNIDVYNEKFIIQYPFSIHDRIKILYILRYNGIYNNRNNLLFNYNTNKNIQKVVNQLEQLIDLENIKLKYEALLKKSDEINKEIKELENIIKQTEEGRL